MITNYSLNCKAILNQSKEVVRCSSRNMWLSSSWCRIKYKEIVIHMFIYFHYASFIGTSITIIGCWKDCHNISLMAPIISIHYKLMCPWDQLKVISMIKLFWDILTKSVPSTSRRNTPTTSVIWIWP